MGIEGLRTATPPGPARKLTEAQRGEPTALVEAGPLAAGYPLGVWTGPMIGDLIERRFGVRALVIVPPSGQQLAVGCLRLAGGERLRIGTLDPLLANS